MRKKQLQTLLGKSSELLLFAKVIPEARFNKLMVEVKSKIRDESKLPEEFADKFAKYVDFKSNFLKLAYPKATLTPEDQKFMEESVASFLQSTDEASLEQRADYLVASAANFISQTETFVREQYMNPETVMANLYQKHQEKLAQEKEKIKEQEKAPEAEPEVQGRYTPQEEIDTKGFYRARKETIEAEKISHGTFYMDNGRIFFGSAEKREPVSYSNWYAGNVDPEQLERHKKLLDRQHFGGPTWENRPMPKSVLDETFEEYLTGIENLPPEKSPKELGLTKEDSWEKVKR